MQSSFTKHCTQSSSIGSSSSTTMAPQGSSKKRRLSQVERDDGLDNDEIPGPASAKRPRSRKLAFHPDVVDNSLWADIHVAKRPGEFYGLDRQLPTSTPKPEKSLSESYMDPSSSEDSPDTDKENTPPPDDFGDRPTASFLSMRGTPDPVSNLNSKERSASILRSVAKVGSTSESSREVPDVETSHRSPLPERKETATAICLRCVVPVLRSR